MLTTSVRSGCARLGALLVLSWPALAAAAGPALPPSSLRDFAWVSEPRLSPDGARLAFVATRVDAAKDDYATALWLIDGAAPPRQVTFEPADALSPRWSPDGRRLAFLSKRSGKAQVHVLELGGGEAWQLTDDPQGAGAFAWSPDGTHIAFLSGAPGPGEALPAEPEPGHSRPPFVTDRLTTRADGKPGWLKAQRAHLWVVRTEQGPRAKAVRVTGGPYDDGAPAWSRDGATLYFSAIRRADADWTFGDTELYAVPADGSRDPVALTDRRGPDDNPVVSPDGRLIAYTGFDDAQRQSYRVTHLYVLDTATGERRELARGLDRSVGDGAIADMGAPRGEGARLVWRRDSKAVYFVSADRGAVGLYEATLDGGYRALTALNSGEIRAFDVGPDGRIVVAYSAPTEPVELYAFPLAAAARRAAWRGLTGFNAALAARAGFVPYEELWLPGAPPSVAAFAGHAPGERQWIQAWLLRPPGFDAAQRYPLVLYIHGGPHTMYGTAFFHEMQVLAHAGYLVLIANPRGSTGYGEAFGNAIQYRYPGDDYEDLMAVLDGVIARGGVDPARLYVAGGSGGGLLSAWAVGHTDRFAAAVVERAVTNWHSFAGASDMNYYFVTHWFRAAPWQGSADYLARSPLSYVERVSTPVLVIHNQDDFRAPLDQGLQFYTALRELRKPARLAVFPDSSHGMSRDGRPEQRIARLGLILDWLGSAGR